MSGKLIILCTPRVASRYFAEAFQKEIGINIQKTHSPEYPLLDQCQIIGIVRDPLDTIASGIAMGHFLHNTPIDHEIDIDSFIKNYINTNKTIIEKAKIIVMYDDLTKDVSSIVKKVINKMDVSKPERPNYNIDKKIQDVKDPIDGYLVSSKTYSQYENIRAKILEYDLCEAYEIYEATRDISRDQLQ